jgi:hypothetical protein
LRVPSSFANYLDRTGRASLRRSRKVVPAAIVSMEVISLMIVNFNGD